MNLPHYVSAKAIRAFTFIELMIVLAVFAIFAFLLFTPCMGSSSRARAQRINCVYNLKQIGLSFRLWAGDHSDKYPMQVATNAGGTMEWTGGPYAFRHFQVLSNELSTPKILVCPADSQQNYAKDFNHDLDNTKISYFVGVDSTATNSQMFLAGDRNITNGIRKKYGILGLTTNQPAGWTHELHERQGNVGMADGSVHQFGNTKLREALTLTGMATNRLAMP